MQECEVRYRRYERKLIRREFSHGCGVNCFWMQFKNKRNKIKRGSLSLSSQLCAAARIYTKRKRKRNNPTSEWRPHLHSVFQVRECQRHRNTANWSRSCVKGKAVVAPHALKDGRCRQIFFRGLWRENRQRVHDGNAFSQRHLNGGDIGYWE